MPLTTTQLKDKARACLLAGAAGDALGYQVEFYDLESIREEYGPLGITAYRLGPKGKALISDDTQMTLFTAAGLLYGKSQSAKGKDLLDAVRCSYYDWLRTQQDVFEEEEVLAKLKNRPAVSRLADVQELYALRAPGNTCLNALAAFEAVRTAPLFAAAPAGTVSAIMAALSAIAARNIFQFFIALTPACSCK